MFAPMPSAERIICLPTVSVASACQGCTMSQTRSARSSACWYTRSSSNDFTAMPTPPLQLMPNAQCLMPSQWNIAVLPPRVLELLVAEHRQGAADALAGFVGHDHIVN